MHKFILFINWDTYGTKNSVLSTKDVPINLLQLPIIGRFADYRYRPIS